MKAYLNVLLKLFLLLINQALVVVGTHYISVEFTPNGAKDDLINYYPILIFLPINLAITTFYIFKYKINLTRIILITVGSIAIGVLLFPRSPSNPLF